jgi:hypothetical protein
VLSVHRRSTRLRALGLLLSASVLLSAGTSLAQASAEDKAAARALATQGSEALKNNRYAEALDLVSRAETLLHAPTHLLMIARAQTGLGKLVAAQETYLKLSHEELAASAPPAFKNAQVAAKEELAVIEPKIASLRIVVEGAVQKKATVKLDDVIVPPVLLGVFRPVDPGHHVLAVFPVGGSPVRTQLDLQDAEKREVKLVVPDGPPPAGVPVNAADNPDAVKPPPAAGTPPPAVEPDRKSSGFMTPLRGAGIGLGVVGVAGVVVGAVFLSKGFSSASSANGLAQMICTPPSYTVCSGGTAAQHSQLTSDDSNAASGKTIGAIALPVGVAALGAGVALLIVGKPKPAAAAPPPQASVVPWFAGTSGGLQGTF